MIFIIQYSMKKCFGLIGVLNIYFIYVYLYLMKVKGVYSNQLVCPFFYYVENWKFLHHRKIAFDPRVCHEFDPRSLGQVQGLREEKSRIRFRSISFFMEKHWGFFLHTKIVMTWRCVIIMTMLIWASSMSLEGKLFIRAWCISSYGE